MAASYFSEECCGWKVVHFRQLCVHRISFELLLHWFYGMLYCCLLCSYSVQLDLKFITCQMPMHNFIEIIYAYKSDFYIWTRKNIAISAINLFLN